MEGRKRRPSPRNWEQEDRISGYLPGCWASGGGSASLSSLVIAPMEMAMADAGINLGKVSQA